MSERPIRLLVTDDLERSRLTVLLRLVLAIPHFIWFSLWSLIALLAAFVNWVAVLLLGRASRPLHRFLASYVKYATQLYAYVYLIADPWPSFDGQDGYPIDLEIAPPGRLSRWRALLRLPLALPAFLLGAIFTGGGVSWLSRSSSRPFGAGLLSVLAFLAWFAILARGRISRGLRDAGAYSLSYGAQVWSYLFLLTDRYPDSNPLAAIEDVPLRNDPIMLIGEDDLRRSRLTVLFRLPLAFPHLLWLALWSILAWLAAIVNWFATLALGRSPAPLHRFLAAFVRYQISVNAFLYLIANPFPGFGGAAGSYPLDTVIREPVRQGRWTVAFRLLLALPVLLIQGVYGSLLSCAAVLGWFASLFTGRMPKGLRGLGVLALRYQAQWLGYMMLLTASYPYSGPCLPGPAEPEQPTTAELTQPSPENPWPTPSLAGD